MKSRAGAALIAFSVLVVLTATAVAQTGQTVAPSPPKPADARSPEAAPGPSRAQIQSVLAEVKQVEPLFLFARLNVEGCFVSTDKGEMHLGNLYLSSLDSANCGGVVIGQPICTIELNNGLRSPLGISYQNQKAAIMLADLLRRVALSCGARQR